MSELFPVETVTAESPRLKWIKKHGIITWYSRSDPEEWFAAFRSNASKRWDGKCPEDFFFWLTAEQGDSRHCSGATEDEALTNLAVRASLPLWNEEEGRVP